MISLRLTVERDSVTDKFVEDWTTFQSTVVVVCVCVCVCPLITAASHIRITKPTGSQQYSDRFKFLPISLKMLHSKVMA